MADPQWPRAAPWFTVPSAVCRRREANALSFAVVFARFYVASGATARDSNFASPRRNRFAPRIFRDSLQYSGSPGKRGGQSDLRRRWCAGRPSRRIYGGWAGRGAPRALQAAGPDAAPVPKAGYGLRGSAPRRRRVQRRAVGGAADAPGRAHRGLLGDRRLDRRRRGRERHRGRGSGARWQAAADSALHPLRARRAAGGRGAARARGAARSGGRRGGRCRRGAGRSGGARRGRLRGGYRRRRARAPHHHGAPGPGARSRGAAFSGRTPRSPTPASRWFSRRSCTRPWE